MYRTPPATLFFFFNDTATTEIYTLSLHDALPILIFMCNHCPFVKHVADGLTRLAMDYMPKGIAIVGINSNEDRKSTRLNSSHQIISYAVFCLKKKKNHNQTTAEPIDYSHYHTTIN